MMTWSNQIIDIIKESMSQEDYIQLAVYNLYYNCLQSTPNNVWNEVCYWIFTIVYITHKNQ
jgi:hypothetical protein